MSGSAPVADTAAPVAQNGQAQLLDAIRDTVRAETAKLAARQDEFDARLTSLAAPQSGAHVTGESVMFGGSPPFVQSGELQNTSRGYSLLKVIGVLAGVIPPEQAKVEMDLSQKLHKAYYQDGQLKLAGNQRSIIMCYGSELLPDEHASLARECRQAFLAGFRPIDPDYVRWASQQGGFANHSVVRQTLSWSTAGSGGDFVPPAIQGEMIDNVRAREWMTPAGVLNIAFPPNGKITMPRVLTDPTHYWVGENTAITESEITTDSVTLTAKKHGVLTTVPNELFRFSMPAFEGVLRMVMAQAMAQGLGRTLLDGSETSTRPPGLDSISGAINLNRDPKFATLNNDGDRIKPRGPSYMAAKIAEADHDISDLAYILRPMLWDTIINLRADAVSANDGAGAYLFRVGGRETGRPMVLDGHVVVPTTQVRADLESLPGSSSAGNEMTAMYAVIGRMLVLARAGVLEFAVSNSGGANTFAQDQSMVRCIEHVDFDALQGDAIAFAKYLAQIW